MLLSYNPLSINAGPFEKSFVAHRGLEIKSYLCTTMHFMSQLRYNPKTRRNEWYYRIKESFRDLTGRVRSRVMLNVGFIDEAGFTRYSSILAGNTADPKVLPDMVDTLAAKSRAPKGANGRAPVIIDAGIAGEDRQGKMQSFLTAF